MAKYTRAEFLGFGAALAGAFRFGGLALSAHVGTITAPTPRRKRGPVIGGKMVYGG